MCVCMGVCMCMYRPTVCVIVRAFGHGVVRIARDTHTSSHTLNANLTLKSVCRHCDKKHSHAVISRAMWHHHPPAPPTFPCWCPTPQQLRPRLRSLQKHPSPLPDTPTHRACVCVCVCDSCLRSASNEPAPNCVLTQLENDTGLYSYPLPLKTLIFHGYLTYTRGHVDGTSLARAEQQQPQAWGEGSTVSVLGSNMRVGAVAVCVCVCLMG